MKKSISICLIVLIASVSFAQKPRKDSIRYKRAVQNAMYPEESKVYKQLVPIDKSNKELSWKSINGEEYVLMVSWKGYIDPYVKAKAANKPYNTGTQWPIWVTASPQLYNRMKELKVKDKKVDRRLRQLLGLPPNSTYTYFVEFWVRTEDLFRPCPDNEITDTSCDVCFPDSVSTEFKAWINNSRISRYYPDPCGLYNQYPWTALGYTYDWNRRNKKHVGLSEFVIKNNADIWINSIDSTRVYLNK